MSTLRVVIADDEPAALAKLNRLLTAEPGVEVVAACSDGQMTVEAIERLGPDAVFLDIEMPERDGLSVVRQLDESRRRVGAPVIVFVTAFDHYAARAFDADAADYLLKPFDTERLRRALAKARERFASPRLLVHLGGDTHVVRLSEVEWIGSVGNYVNIHTASSRVLMRETMARLSTVLDGRKFVRIHRGAIVNLDCVAELRSTRSGGSVLTVRSGTRLRVSRRYRAALKAALDSVQAPLGQKVHRNGR